MLGLKPKNKPVDMHGRNPKNMTEEETAELLRRYRAEFLYYAPRVLKVQTIDGRIVPFELNRPQRILHGIVEGIKAAGRPVRLVALKARRMGFSTYFGGRYYHKTGWNANRYAAQITHEPDATDTLFKMIKRFYNYTPTWIRPSILYNNMRLLEFNTKDGKGLNSSFRVATAEKDDYGSGQLITYCHLSELPKWPNQNTASSLLTSILQCVPDDMESEVVFEATAKGIGGEFYERFWGARFRIWVKKIGEDGEPIVEEEVNESASESNLYTSIFLPWFVFEIYREEVPENFKLIANKSEPDKCEVSIKDAYGLTDEQIYWRRKTVENKCGGNVDIFNQEYPANPMQAFIGTGQPVFDNIKLMRLKESAKKPIMRYDLLAGAGQWISNPSAGLLRVWKEPQRGRAYIIGADVAEGLAHGDFSVADVVDHITGEQVAQYHGHMDADLFGQVLHYLGMRYNEAWICCERNNHGLTTITWLVSMNYPRIYAEMVPEPPGRPRKRYGWLTTRATKTLIIDGIVQLVREDSHGVACAETFGEMMTFKRQDNGAMEADVGQFDDRVMSYAIAQHVRSFIPVRKIGDRRGDGKFSRKKHTKKDLPAKGWT